MKGRIKLKSIKKYMAMIMAVLSLSMLMTVSAFAADGQTFSDVGPDSPWHAGVEYGAEHGITSGTGDGKFSPDHDITVRQWAVMICRAYGKEVETLEDKPFGTEQLNLGFQEGWLDVGAMIDPDSSMCRAYAYESIFRVEKLPVFNACLYENVVPYESYYVTVAKGNDLCSENAHGLDLISRGEAIQLIYLMQTKDLAIAKPALLDNIQLVNTDGAYLEDFLLELKKIPETILYEFNARGWQYCIDSEYVDDFGERIGMECAGCCSYKNKSIYVKADYATTHEFGHFYHQFIGFDATVEELYAKESESARNLLGDYSTTNHKEYFAEVFDYWIHGYSREALELVAPETFSYIQKLEMNSWMPLNEQ